MIKHTTTNCLSMFDHLLELVFKGLKVVCNNYMATYDGPFSLSNKVKIHQRYLQYLAIEICKCRNKLNPGFMRKANAEKNIPYPLRRVIPFLYPATNTKKYGKSIKIQRRRFVEQLTSKFKACELYFLYFTNRKHFKNYGKVFLFHIKIFVRSRDT